MYILRLRFTFDVYTMREALEDEINVSEINLKLFLAADGLNVTLIPASFQAVFPPARSSSFSLSPGKQSCARYECTSFTLYINLNKSY